ncbi:MAG TPA: hypothetical protein PKE06_17330 [Flavilitoribacter sp.]|nr:hypothetical protein [Flavilitoribacter sp.]HMQ88598.1 hypothetical protein [Flavilitoribacter sp.]
MTTLTRKQVSTWILGRTVNADVVFGSPSKKCAGTGICKVSTRSEALIDPELPCCNKSAAEIGICRQDRLVFRIEKQGLCAKLVNSQFAFGRFKMDESVFLPLFVSAAFNLPPIQLTAGVFPVQFLEDHIEIELRFQQA